MAICLLLRKPRKSTDQKLDSLHWCHSTRLYLVVMMVSVAIVVLSMPAAGDSAKEAALEFVGNGLDEAKEFDCSATVHVRSVGPTFDIAGSWELSFDFVAPRLEAGLHQLVLWGDGRGGHDPVYIRLDGAKLEAAVSNTHRDTICGLIMPLDPGVEGKPVHIVFRHLASTNMLELRVDSEVQRKEATLVPSVDQPMPVVVGGADANSQRFKGTVRSLKLGNLAGVAPSNGLHERRVFNCSKMAYYRVMSESFDPGKSWDLMFDLTAPKLDPGWHMLLCWGDDRPGMDTIYLRLDGPMLEAAVSNCRDNSLSVIKQRIAPSDPNRPVPVHFSYSAEHRRLKLAVGKFTKTNFSEVTPWADRAMPITIGGAGTASQRFSGTISSIRLGNVTNGESLEATAKPLNEEFSPGDLKALAKLPPLNRKVLEFALEHEGYLVDVGDCWNFANHAFEAAGAKRRDTSVWGDIVKPEKALPGDIFQSPSHVMIVLHNHGDRRFTIFNANGPPNGRRTGRNDTQLSSDIQIFRPSK